MEVVKHLLRKVRFALVGSAMSRVMKRVAPLLDLPRSDALELFARAGDFHTLDYARKVKTVELWEIDPQYEPLLRSRFPRSRVRIVDTYEQIAKCQDKFDLVVSDNPTSFHGPHCDHFDLFPHIFNVLKDRACVVLTVLTEVPADVQARYPHICDEKHLAARKAFYGVEDAKRITPDQMIATYKRLFAANGFTVETAFFEPRPRTYIDYIAIIASRTPA